VKEPISFDLELLDLTMPLFSKMRELFQKLELLRRPWIVFVRSDFESIEWGFCGIEL